MQKQKYILITRPTEEAACYASELEAMGFRVFIQPVLEINPVPFTMPAPADYQALLFTSVNGVRAFPEKSGFGPVQVYCIGDRTAEEAAKKGFENIISAGGSGEDLAALAAQKADPRGKKLLHVRGEHAAQELDKIFQNLGFACDKLVVYSAKPAAALYPECAALIKNKEVGAVTFFSRRTAETFMELCGKQGLLDYLKNIKLLSISRAVLKSVPADVWAGTYSAAAPDRAAMNSLLRTHCGPASKGS
ncbi:MAG: uroporphyrinogen-III synthase [Alphaproteobacteria bacterium]|nr:uroporphyrinogen-III synthase [Alphaproteobacteria bacterium]